MEKLHKDAIISQLVLLCNSGSIQPLVTHLVQKKVFNNIRLQAIQAKHGDYLQMQELCMSVQTRGPQAFRHFVESLYEIGDDHLAQPLVLAEYNKRHGLNITRFQDLPADTRNSYQSAAAGETNNSTVPSTANDHDLKLTYRTSIEVESDVVPQSAYQQARSENEQGVYEMESEPRGRMLIINNNNFHDPQLLSTRTGSQHDIRRLEEQFGGHVGFHVTTKQDLTTEGMKSALDSFVEELASTGVHAAAVALLSHGASDKGRDYIYGVDSVPCDFPGALCLDTVTRLLDNCKAMANKPKLIVTQICRQELAEPLAADACLMGSTEGSIQRTNSTEESLQSNTDHVDEDNDDNDVNGDNGDNGDNSEEEELREEQHSSFVQAQNNNYDMLFAHSTLPGRASYRDPERGTVYVQELCDGIEQHAETTDMLDLLTKVNAKLANRLAHQMPMQGVMLRKKWFLNPKPTEREAIDLL